MEEYDLLPDNVKAIMDTFNQELDSYKECNRLLNEVEKIGWTFDYYLDGIPYNFKQIEK